jgi:protein-S-isoprenylcysteine O-methyltransferase Ste14
MEDATMIFDYFRIARDLWLVLCVVWLFGLLTAKPDARTQSLDSRLLELGLSLLAFSLVFTSYFRSGWRAWLFVPHNDVTGAIGLLMVLLGVSFSIWARLQLGGNWSATVSVKEGHTLIRRGPYTIVRHPIYSGLLLAYLGVAMIVGEVRGLLGVGILFLSFWLKSRTEERFMLEQFGADYSHYRHQVKALIPHVF